MGYSRNFETFRFVSRNIIWQKPQTTKGATPGSIRSVVFEIFVKIVISIPYINGVWFGSNSNTPVPVRSTNKAGKCVQNVTFRNRKTDVWKKNLFSQKTMKSNLSYKKMFSMVKIRMENYVSSNESRKRRFSRKNKQFLTVVGIFSKISRKKKIPTTQLRTFQDVRENAILIRYAVQQGDWGVLRVEFSRISTVPGPPSPQSGNCPGNTIHHLHLGARSTPQLLRKAFYNDMEMRIIAKLIASF